MAVVRKLPNSDAGRATALDRAALKLSITAPADIVLTAQTQARLATVRTAFNLNLALRGQALGNQVSMTPGKDAKRKIAGLYAVHYILGCDKAALRGETGFVKADRSSFQLDATNDILPSIETDNDVMLWGQRVLTGDANRITAGKPAMLFPTIASVTIKYNDFVTIYGDYSLLKTAYDNAQETIENMREEVDGLIVRIWNEAEAAYSEEAAPSKRRNARDWGVVYVLVAGTAPSPEDFSIVGTITDSATGNPIADAVVHIVEADVFVMTDSQGKYYVSVLDPGTYTLNVHKAGYLDHQAAGIVVTGDAVVTHNIELAPGVLFEGTINPGQTIAINTTGITFIPSTFLQLLAEGTTLRFSFSTNPGDPLIVPLAENSDGQQSTVTASDIGLNPSRMQLQVYNAGVTVGTYKITIAI